MTKTGRKLAALMLTDMVGYTSLSQRNEPLALDLLSEHNDLIRDSVSSHGGREIKHTGDGFLIEFPSVLQAVSSSIDIQRQLHDRNETAEQERRFQIRIGLHLGDVEHREGDIFGDGVNITARNEPLASPGGICLSQPVHAQIWNKIDRPIISLGMQELKNLQNPIEVFRIALPWEEQSAQKVETKPRKKTRLAVLPLTNISPDPEDAYFTDGMTGELIFTLSKITGLKVISQTSVQTYKGSTKTTREIGQELDVGTIIEGSVRKAGTRLRITVQLIDVNTDAHLWSEQYDRELEDVFAIQSEISLEVAKGLKGILKHVKIPKGKQPTGKLGAYTKYLKGRHFWSRRTKPALLRAIDAFHAAIEVDPSFARAYSGLADAYTVMANHGYESSTEAFPKAKAAATKALELEPDLAEAHASLGIAHIEFTNRPEAGEQELRKAVELNPSYSTGHHWLAIALASQGRLHEAKEEIDKAAELDPQAHVTRVVAGDIRMALHEYQEAKTLFERALELEPSYLAGIRSLAVSEMALWNWCRAEKLLDATLQRNPDHAPALAGRARLSLILGRRKAADAAMEAALELEPHWDFIRERAAIHDRFVGRTDDAIRNFMWLRKERPRATHPPLMIALAHLTEGRTDKALEWLSVADRLQGSSRNEKRLMISTLQGVACAMTGRLDEALRIAEEVEADYAAWWSRSAMSMLYFHAGEAHRAYACLEEGVARHEAWLLNLPVEPLLRPFRSDSRFQAILEVMGLAHVAKAAERANM